MERVLFAGVLGYLTGICAVVLPLSLSHVSLLLILLGGAFFVLHFLKRMVTYLLVGVVCITASLGVFRVSLVPDALPDAFMGDVGNAVFYEARVVSEPDTRETTQRITLEVERDNQKTRILAVAPLFPEVSYGDVVTVSGELLLPEPFDVDAERTFAYDAFLRKDGVFGIVPRARIALIENRGPTDSFWGVFGEVKRVGTNALSAALPEPHASLASGLILGGKQGLGSELLNAFTVAGLVHIVVLSGYNVMVVAEFVLRFFGLFSRRIASIAAGIAIGTFVLISGAGAASIRAGVMASIALFGRATGKTYSAFRALVFAGTLMLVWNPLLLLYDPGFQLSFIATLGLIFGAPLFEKHLSYIRTALFRELVSATLAAQIAVLPLLLYQNGLFSLVALPANVLVLPLVPLAMLTSFVTLLFGVTASFVAPIVGLPAYALLSLIIFIAEFLSTLPVASFSVPAFPLVLVFVAYGVLGYLTYRLTRSQSVSLPPPSSR